MAAQPKARPLTAYDAKRDFTQSPEPRGKTRSKPKSAALSFCVQKHLASHLHYDFRLEHRGVLLSWAVPKGPSLNPADKRMAVHVEDHPLDYGNFEGVIPSGYGAGVVLLWDRGTWMPEAATADIDAALTKGELKFRLDGLKLKGSWVLVRTRRRPTDKGPEQWLLIKHKDAWAGDIDVTTLAQSVKSFGGLPDVVAANPPVADWTTHPPVRGGETGRLFQDVLASARTLRDKTGEKPPKSKAVKSIVVPAAALKIGKDQPKFTNQQKILFPNARFTKGNLVDYYTRVAPLILPHLVGRAVTLNRFPDGVDGKSFFEKRCNAHRPEWVKSVRVPGQTAADKTIDYCTLADLASLQWAANAAAIELHVPLALAAEPDRPTAMIFDLDPGPPATFAACVAIGRRLKSLLDELGLVSVPKTSGGKGLHVLVPLNTPGVTFDDTKSFARAVALTLQRDDPKGVLASMSRSERAGRVFIDWSQNDRSKTNACVFSVRAREQPSVSWPLSWDELIDGRVIKPRLASEIRGDEDVNAFALVLRRRQKLPVFGRAESPVR